MIKKGLKIRGFSKTNIEKTYLRAEVNIKSRGILNNSGPEPRAAGGPVRSVSNDRLPSSESVAKITAISTSLTSLLFIIPHWNTFNNEKLILTGIDGWSWGGRVEESKGKAVKGHHSSESVVDYISDMYINIYESNTNINTYVQIQI